MGDTRRSRRVPFVAKIEAQAGGFPFIALAENISVGGILLHTTNSLADGEVVHLQFLLPGTDKEIRATGTVRHVKAGTYMGIEFKDVDPADQEAIRKFVEAL